MYRGQKITGDQRGRKLGFPTINIQLSQCDMGKILSKYQDGGVFLTQVFLSEKHFFGLLHLGSRPTFDSKEFRVEIFVFNFDEILSDGEVIHFNIQEKIRKVMSFSSPKDLIDQIKKDVKQGKNKIQNIQQKNNNNLGKSNT